jgi:hypothetical protein
MKTFQEFAAENLAGFGWTIDPSEIPDWETVYATMQPLSDWWHSLDEETKAIIVNSSADLSDGLWTSGKLSGFPALYNLIHGVPYGDIASTFDDVILSLQRARNQVDEQPDDEASGITDIQEAEGSSSDDYAYQ